MLLPVIMADVIANNASNILWLMLLPRCHICILTISVHVYMSMLVVTIWFLFCFVRKDSEGQYILHFLVHVTILKFGILFELHVLYYSM